MTENMSNVEQPGTAFSMLQTLAHFSIAKATDEQAWITSVLEAVSAQLNVHTPFLSTTLDDRFDVLAVFNTPDGCTLPNRTALPLSESYCSTAIKTPDMVMTVEDARRHPVFRAMPITQTTNIGAYIGTAVRLSSGEVIGTLCGLDPAPRTFTDAQRAFLQMMAYIVASVLERKLRAIAPLPTDIFRPPSASGSVAALTDEKLVHKGIGLIFGWSAEVRQALMAEGYSPHEIVQPVTLDLVQQAIHAYKPRILIFASENMQQIVQVVAAFRQQPEQQRLNRLPVLCMLDGLTLTVRAYMVGVTACVPSTGTRQTIQAELHKLASNTGSL